jgi:hypothetical protein
MSNKKAAYLANTLVYCPICGFLLDNNSRRKSVGEFIDWARAHLPEVVAAQGEEKVWSGRKKVVIVKIYQKGTKEPTITKRKIKLMRIKQVTRYDCGFCGLEGLGPQIANALMARQAVNEQPPVEEAAAGLADKLD